MENNIPEEFKGTQRWINFGLWIVAILVIIMVGFFAFNFLNQSDKLTDEELFSVTKCIRDNTILYTQLGCHACENQEKVFREFYDVLDIVDCFYEGERCAEADIVKTPTWNIRGERVTGAQSIKKLRELTGC